jgi:hypothetical protein
MALLQIDVLIAGSVDFSGASIDMAPSGAGCDHERTMDLADLWDDIANSPASRRRPRARWRGRAAR